MPQIEQVSAILQKFA